MYKVGNKNKERLRALMLQGPAVTYFDMGRAMDPPRSENTVGRYMRAPDDDMAAVLERAILAAKRAKA